MPDEERGPEWEPASADGRLSRREVLAAGLGALAGLAAGAAVLDDRRGLMALYRRDPHLGCRVQWCRSSQWFENPCHDDRYNRWGEWVAGPAPRGLDRFVSWVDGGGRMVVDLAHYLVGPARDRRILDQEPAGPHCVG